MNIKELKKRLGITNKDLADIFEYKNEAAYRNSSAKKRIERAIVRLCNLKEKKL